MTDPLGQSQVIPYLAGLSKFGYRFTILSCDKKARYDLQKEYVNQMLEPHRLKWVSVPYTKNPPVLSSMYDVLKLKRTAKELHRQDQFDMVHTRPGVPTVVALWLKKKLGIKFFNDVRGFWADERVDGGQWNLNNPLYRKVYNFFKKHEYECLEKADYTTCLTFNAKKEMHTWNHIMNQPIPIEVIPCSVDLDLFKPSAVHEALAAKFKTDLGIADNDIVVSYLGSLGGWYLTDEMMQFAKVLSEKNDRIKFLFITPHKPEEVWRSASRAGLDRKLLITCSAKRHEVPALLSLTAYSFFFIKPCYSKISSSPTKHGEIMAMGIPVITNTGVGDVDDIVKKYEAGVLVNGFTEEKYSVAADELLSRQFNKAKIRNGAEEFYALENAIATYRKVYKKILGE